MEYKLSEIFDLQMGKTPDRHNSEYWVSGTEPWISIADLSKCDKYIYETTEHITKKAVCESGIKIIPADTVIMSFKLSIGKLAITPSPMYSNEAIIAFVDKNVLEIDPTYLFYLLMQRDWNEGTNKAVMGITLNKATLSKVKIKIHSFEKQKEIAQILEKVRGLIISHRQQVVELDKLIKARFVEMFGDPVTNSKGFLTQKGEEFFSLSNGKFVPEEKRQDKGIPAYGGNGVSWYTKESLVEDDTIVVGRVGFQSGNVHFAPGPLWVTDNAMYISNYNKEQYDLKFLCALMEYMDFTRFQDAGDLKKITQKPFMQMEFLFPPIALQRQFVAFVEQTDKSKVAVQAALDETQTLFDSLMQRYFG